MEENVYKNDWGNVPWLMIKNRIVLRKGWFKRPHLILECISAQDARGPMCIGSPQSEEGSMSVRGSQTTCLSFNKWPLCGGGRRLDKLWWQWGRRRSCSPSAILCLGRATSPGAPFQPGTATPGQTSPYLWSCGRSDARFSFANPFLGLTCWQAPEVTENLAGQPCWSSCQARAPVSQTQRGHTAIRSWTALISAQGSHQEPCPNGRPLILHWGLKVSPNQRTEARGPEAGTQRPVNVHKVDPSISAEGLISRLTLILKGAGQRTGSRETDPSHPSQPETSSKRAA